MVLFKIKCLRYTVNLFWLLIHIFKDILLASLWFHTHNHFLSVWNVFCLCKAKVDFATSRLKLVLKGRWFYTLEHLNLLLCRPLAYILCCFCMFLKKKKSLDHFGKGKRIDEEFIRCAGNICRPYWSIFKYFWTSTVCICFLLSIFALQKIWQKWAKVCL